MNLYLDVGATHIKVMYGDKVDIFQYLTKEYVNIREFSEFIRKILFSYDFDKLYTCSQMHGFAIEGYPNYISWMCEDVEPFDTPDLKNTGLFSCHGLPYFNSQLFDGGRMINLVEACLDEGYHVSHETLECGTGFYDLVNRQQKESRFELPKVVRYEPTVCGKICNAIVYAPLGDLQSAVMGIDQELEEGDIIINMGTGSQIIQIGRTFREDTENRTLFDYILNCVTHIPSGRSMKFYKDLLNLPEFNELEYNDILNSNEIIKLGYFKSAYGFDDYGGIRGISDTTTKYTLACSLIRCYVEQYVDILNDKFKNRCRIFLTGGISKNIPIIRRLFEYHLSEGVIVEDNDTLKGLYKYSLYDDTRFWFNR
jgi:hypothetical protein